MKAELLLHQRIDYDEGGIVELVLWRVPSPVLPSVHRLKCSLFYGCPGVRRSDTTMDVEKVIIGISSAPRPPTGSLR
jgi:hypothetical protein